jgi:hypothetical protein
MTVSRKYPDFAAAIRKKETVSDTSFVSHTKEKFHFAHSSRDKKHGNSATERKTARLGG